MIFCLLGLTFELFVLLAVITNLRVIATIYVVAKHKKNA